MKTVSLKLSPKEKKDEVAEFAPSKGPEYPYGTCLHLDGDEMKKLGIDVTQAKAGTAFNITGQAKLVGFSMRQREGGKEYSSVELQITDLGVEAVGEKTAAKTMYPDMKE